MSASYISTFVLTLLLAIGLAFFLRAASKDRTTVVDVSSKLPPLEVLSGISNWLESRGWKREGGDIERKVLRFQGNVLFSPLLAVFLSILCALGGGCLGLVICQLFPVIAWWPLVLVGLGPLAGLFYRQRAFRIESVELQLISSTEDSSSVLRLRAHRDELIAMESELGKNLALESDGSLVSSPI
ncbi:cofactor assembly of complex C subunit B [Prochlorococcus marinus]|uniref:Cofactor assembly of complex C subunit B n=1 Tax=Prochlorococcus marinus (strain MIT 9211) TaxID=93059 RepID=A9BCS3_PROM4|nr:cofactor assembly of complex C subunit B [Prochlorococcus marinus]ABX09635.1 conserved hypothetical protein [Prochlorococcus marinus str. MIT 9211]